MAALPFCCQRGTAPPATACCATCHRLHTAQRYPLPAASPTAVPTRAGGCENILPQHVLPQAISKDGLSPLSPAELPRRSVAGPDAHRYLALVGTYLGVGAMPGWKGIATVPVCMETFVRVNINPTGRSRSRMVMLLGRAPPLRTCPPHAASVHHLVANSGVAQPAALTAMPAYNNVERSALSRCRVPGSGRLGGDLDRGLGSMPHPDLRTDDARRNSQCTRYEWRTGHRR